ncbi:MAG: PA14 domain-containing protein, partial [Actinomycetota bacterium]
AQDDPAIDFNWPSGPGQGLGATCWSATWSGFFALPAGKAAGAWSFGTIAQGGVSLTVGSTPVTSGWSPVQTPSTTPVWGSPVSLSAGQMVTITLQYYAGGTPGQLQLWAEGPGQAAVVVAPTWYPSPANPLPDGWSLSSGASLEYSQAVITPGKVVLIDPTGADHVYLASQPGAFTPPPGESSVVALDANHQLSVQGDDGYTYVFNPSGQLTSVFSATDDAHPASPVYSYTQVTTTAGYPARLSAVTDPVTGRSIVLNYSGEPHVSCPLGTGYVTPTATMLCQIDYSAFYGAGAVTNLYYTQSGPGVHLSRIEDPGAAGDTPLTDYLYDAFGRLAGVRDVLNNDLIRADVITTGVTSTAHMTQVSYDQLSRATALTAPVVDTSSTPGPVHDYTYLNPTMTVLSIPDGAPQPLAATTTVDSSTGNVLSYTDGAGDTTRYSWDGSLPASTIDPTGIETTTIYNAENEATDSYGPAPASTFSGLVSSSGPHATTGYDQGIDGLAASFFDDATLSPSAPTQTVQVTGVGDPSGSLDANWATTPPPGVTTPGWSGRFSGYVTATVTGSYAFSVTGTGTTALYVNNAPYTGPVTLSPGTPVPIRLDYTAPSSGGASLGLDWTTGGSTTLVPGLNLDPGYGLATTNTDADAKKTATSYTGPGVDPAAGLPTASTVDPGGLNLTTTTFYEPTGVTGTGYYRVTGTMLPKGPATTVTNTYYSPMQTTVPANTCTSASVPVQAGLLATTTGAGANPVIHTYIYDGAGRVIATEVAGDAQWSCTSYDARGRIASTSDAEGRTTTYDYSNPAVTAINYTDSANNAKSTSTQLDFDGRQVAYTDELANSSTQGYDPAGRLATTARGGSPLSTLSYDAANRVSGVTDSVGGGSFGFGYNAASDLTTISRPNGVTTYQGYSPTTGWLTSITSSATSGPLPAAANSSYTYSPAKRISAQTSEGQISSFGYDAAGRLQSQDVNGVTTTYAYDADSNRCAIDASSCTSSFAYNDADEITASPGVASYGYDYRGDVTETALGAAIAYDANAHAIQINDGASPTATVVNNDVAPSGRVLTTAAGPLGLPLSYDTAFGYDSSSDSPSYTEGLLGLLAITSYLNGPGGLLAQDTTLLGVLSTSVYPIANAHGDIVGTTDSSGAFSANPPTDAFGVGSSAPASNLGYLGNDERYTTGAGLGPDPDGGAALRPGPGAVPRAGPRTGRLGQRLRLLLPGPG